MKKNRLVIISLLHDWNWPANYQRQTALQLVKNNQKVIIIETNKRPVNIRRLIQNRTHLVRTGENGIVFIRLLHLLPFERFSLIYNTNRRISLFLIGVWLRFKYLEIRIVENWIYHPNQFWIYTNITHWKWFKIINIYDCMDYFVLNKGSILPELIQAEKKIVNEANLVIAVSHKLKKWLLTYRKDIEYIDQGFTLPSRDFKNRKLFNIHPKSKKPIIGYVGSLNERLDYSTMLKLIEKNQQWQFVFWGPIQLEFFNQHEKKLEDYKKILLCENVVMGSSQDTDSVYSIVRTFDVAIIPYDLNISFNQYCNPLKLYEYFYAGKPVVSTNIEQVKDYPEYVFIARSLASWQKAIEDLLETKWSEEAKSKQRQVALSHSWKKRIEKINYLLNEEINKIS